jgi:hypothetical protein
MPEIVIVDAQGREHVFPDGFDPKRAAQIVKGAASPKPDAPVSLTDAVMQDNPMLSAPMRGVSALLRFAKANPVTAGAMAGGALAAPLTGGASIPASMAAAGLGAAGGAGSVIAGRQLLSGKPESGTETLKTMASEGGAAALGQGAGMGIAKLAGTIAPKLARAVLKPSKALQNEYGGDDLVQSFLQERLPVGKSAEAGSRASASAAKADAMIADAQAAGASPISVREVAKELRPVRDTAKLRTRLGKPDETANVAARVKSIKSANPNGIALTDAQPLKREAQKLSSRTFRAIDRGADVNDIVALADKGVATGLRKGIEARVPGVKDVNTKTQALMGLEEALSDAEMRSPGFMGTNPVTWLGAVAPGLGSHMAFGADMASRAPMAGTLRNALIAALLGEDRP